VEADYHVTYSLRATNQATTLVPTLPDCLLDESLIVYRDVHLEKDPNCSYILKMYLPQPLHALLH
jgi:hypothetical protein